MTSSSHPLLFYPGEKEAHVRAKTYTHVRSSAICNTYKSETIQTSPIGKRTDCDTFIQWNTERRGPLFLGQRNLEGGPRELFWGMEVFLAVAGGGLHRCAHLLKLTELDTF